MDERILFIDTETTNATPDDKCGLIQIAGSIDINRVEKRRFNIYCDIFAGDIVTEEALEKNHKTMEGIESYQSPFDAYKELVSILEKYVDKYDPTDKLVVVAYFSQFDNNVLRHWFKKCGDNYFGSWFWNPWIDCMNLAMYMYQDQRHKFGNFKMKTVAEFMGFQTEDNLLHDAEYDKDLCREMYYELTGEEQ